MTDQHSTSNAQRGPRVAAFGEWGDTNLGDWAIHEGVLKFFRGFVSGVDCFQCGALQPLSDPLAYTAGLEARGLQPYARSAAVPSMGSALRHLKRSLRGVRQEFMMRRLMPRLAACDVICVGGGTLLTDVNLYFPQSLSAISRAAEELRKPLWCLGCGAEGEWSARGRAMIADFVAHCDFIAVRDRDTAERIADLSGKHIPLFGDFALPLVSRPSRVPAARRYMLGINISAMQQSWATHQQEYESIMVELVRTFAAITGRDMEIALFTTGATQDDYPAMRVYQQLSSVGATIHRPDSLDELRTLVSECEIVLATRLHAAIIALAVGRPVIGISPTPTLENFLTTFGLERFSFRVPNTTVSELITAIGNRSGLDNQWQLMDQDDCMRTRDKALTQLAQLGHWPMTAS